MIFLSYVILLASLLKLVKSWEDLSRIKCDDIFTKEDRLATKAQIPPKLSGLWVSERCEVRPGRKKPEYLVRRYQFFNNTHFRVIQYYYSDPHCTQPFYSLEANGRLPRRAMTQSLLIDDAITLIRPHIYRVTVLPYTYAAARFLKLRIIAAEDRACGSLRKREDWIPGKRYQILLFTKRPNRQSRGRLKDYDCTERLGFSLNEFQLIKVQITQRSKAQLGTSGKILMLGDIPENFRNRLTYVPGTFQDPIYEAESVHNCPDCQRIRHSNLLIPPIFMRPLPLPQPPYGAWTSDRCENRAQGSFSTRRLIFHRHQSSTWTIIFDSYHDARCLRPFYSIEAGGKYRQRGQAPLNVDATSYDFTIRHLSITPKDQSSLRLFSSYKGMGCGSGGDSWRINVPQNVTATHGCSLLALYVPETKFEIVKVTRGESGIPQFYMGRSDVHSSGGNGMAREPSSSEDFIRPMTFQPPLLPCKLPPAFSATVQQQYAQPGKINIQSNAPSSSRDSGDSSSKEKDRQYNGRRRGTQASMPIGSITLKKEAGNGSNVILMSNAIFIVILATACVPKTTSY